MHTFLPKVLLELGKRVLLVPLRAHRCRCAGLWGPPPDVQAACPR